MPIVFAAIAPHPPIILPSVGSSKDRTQVKNTIEALEKLEKNLKKLNPDSIIISSPHPDWGFEVPLYFIAKNFQGKIKRILIGSESPQYYFNQGQKTSRGPSSTSRGRASTSSTSSDSFGIIASGDLSHCLKEDGPYGFHPDGPKFDKDLIEALKKKDIETILKLNELYPEAGECGLRSVCFVLGILESSKINYQPEILSYQSPFGVGYLVADFKISQK